MIRLLSLLWLMGTIVAPSIAHPRADEIASEEYSVYSSLLNSRFLSRQTNLALIEGRTQFDDMVAIPEEFENDLRPKIADQYFLQRRFHIRVNYRLLTPTQLDALFKRNLHEAWDIYWKRYPRATGLLTFSRVGFNATKTRAFVYVADVCGALCGYGRTFVLEKQNRAWKIVDERQLWIS